MRTQLLLGGFSWALLCSCTSEPTTPSETGTGGANNPVGTGGVANATTGSGGTSVGNTTSTPSSGGNVSTTTPSTGGAPSSGGSVNTSSTTSLGGTTSMGGTSTTSGGKSGTASATGGKAGGGSNAGGSAGKTSTGGSSSVSAAGTSTSASNGGAGGKANTGGGGSGTGGTTSTAAVGCTREGLQAAVDAYLATQASGDISKMPLASTVKYTENFKTTTKGIWQTALTVAYQRSLLDVTACQTFSEIFVTPGDHQYVLGIRLAVKDGAISEIESIVTDGTVSGTTITSDDWNFDAKAYMECSKSEDWSVVPPEKQSTREALIAAGEAYFLIFSDKTAQVPWGEPCFRLEGGKGCTPAMDKAGRTCNVGIPDGITFKSTHWVVDVDLNAAVGFTLFAGGSPDTHLFRLVDGKIRYVHTLTQGTG